MQLRDQIVRRAWPPGSKIPSENQLTRRLGVSRVSLREALQNLASLGLLESRQGGGTYVMDRIVLFQGVSDGLSYHRRILDAIKAHDAGLAESLMEEHILRTIKRLQAEERIRLG